MDATRADSSSSLASVSVESASLQYLNSNLLSHGFAKLPVCLDGLATQDERNVVAIMSSLLQQRIVSFLPSHTGKAKCAG